MRTAQEKTALVTGASGGIGQAIAERLALQAGCQVCALDLKAESLHEVVEGIVAKGGRATSYVADLSDEDSLKRTCGTILANHGIDILVNNAGIGGIFPTEEYPDDSWHQIMAVNLTAAFLLAKQCLPGMRQRGWGRIINLSSINGLRAGSGRLAYGTSKTALIGLTRQLAIDTAQWGITVNAVAPGAIQTPLLEAMAAAGNSTKEHVLDFIPMNRFGLPEEVASAVAFLVSNEAAYITGHTLTVDGGFAAAGVLARDPIRTRTRKE